MTADFIHLEEYDPDYQRRKYRRQIKDSFDNRCAYCGSDGGGRLTLDHLLARSKGGETTGRNLAAACNSCNLSKGDKDAWEWYSRQSFFSTARWNRIKEITGYGTTN